MTIAIKFDDETGRITNRYFINGKDEEEWVNTDESNWPEPDVARDEIPIYYYIESKDKITYQKERQVTENIHVELEDGEITTGGKETVTIYLVNEFVNPTKPFDDIAVLNYDRDIKLHVDGSETSKTLTNGRVTFDLTTDKSTGSEIEIVAELLHDAPAESDSATIEVVSA